MGGKLILYKMSKKMGKPPKKEYKFSKRFILEKELEEFYIDITKKEKSNPNLYDIYKNLQIINNICK